MNYLIGLVGMWLTSDGLYSIALYINAPSFREGENQSWTKDHLIRIVRILCGIFLMVVGYIGGR